MGAWGRKDGLHSEGRRFQRGERGQASKAPLEEEEKSIDWMSGCKGSPGSFAESWFHFKSS